ncbi:LysM peptidoglycan-binding domain-containing protein [Halanaerobium sp. MA284_MarDTE_T2]|uniref:LysM peptidoglycan-binding domain-containing protein n=1 Tax=Halanaerobium sp. MA284_MarDTE_T2 TaxID=2183913 RepID=UPI000DF4C55C|nr:LysM peptidoglycan-binding domain-containing protein [Halanaerobium sp. MA284_MarDTE_T2]RCW51480.1 murein DD-endopeptidase MepM/ murein hydrolase activator NlpD [Halanaerobium sp. MA284_MarDTE_T2]
MLIFLFVFSVSVSAFKVDIRSRGKDVKEVQRMLQQMDYDVSPDGIFGQRTKEIVEEFQQKEGLKVDGVVGNKTYQLLKARTQSEIYTVKKGDTLSDIADKFNITISELKRINGLNSNIIKIGQELNIKNNYITDNKSENKNDEENNILIVHEVKSGDTLSEIAHRYNTSIKALREKNNLNGDFLSIGKKIIIRNSKIDADASSEDQSSEDSILYEVRKGDTLSEIADRFNITVSELKRENSIKSNFIKVGQKLLINNNGIGSSKLEVNNIESIVHKVKKGEALTIIAKKYGTDVDTIKQANNLHGDKIYAGQELVIRNFTSSGPIQLKKGVFIWPVMGRISSNFGWRNHPVKRSREFHNGLDIAVPNGTAVKAAASGTVTQSSWMTGFGRTIIIDHGNNVETLYAHNSRLLVSVGTEVKAGQKIALAGSSGLSTGSHLHFGVLLNGKPINPVNYLP